MSGFGEEEILPELGDVAESELQRISHAVRAAGADVFQIWGIPAGGGRIFRRIRENDYWLLLDTDRPGGTISYAGRVLCKIENPSFRLSNYLWGEAKFPLIMLLDGFRTQLEVTDFKEMFGYNNPRWEMRGFSYPIAGDRIQKSQFGTEEAFIHYLRSFTQDARPEFDEPPPDEFVVEGGIALAVHLNRERDRTLVAKFKQSLQSFECCVCGFDFEKTYGKLGAAFIEAHHVTPLGHGGMRETRVADLRPVCSNCHRMLHKALGITVEDLQRVLEKNS
jgi:hypothetical protein